MAIAIPSQTDPSSTPDRPVAIVPVANLRRALATIRKVAPKGRGRSVRPVPQLVTLHDGFVTAGDSHNAGMVTIPLDRTAMPNDPQIVPLDALAAAAKGAKGSVAIYSDRIVRSDGAIIAFSVEQDHAESVMRETDCMTEPMPPRAFTLTGQQWCDLASIVGSHASTDDTRPVLTGIYVSPVAQDGTVDLVATDSYRLAIASVQTDYRMTDQHCLIPVRMFAAVAAHIAKHSSASVEVCTSSDATWIRVVDCDPEGDPGERYTLIAARTRIIDGQYPNYRALTPEGMTRHVMLTDDACDRIITFARMRKTNAPMRITVEQSMLTAEWEGMELAVPCDVAGEQDSITFGLNAAFVADCLSAMPQGGASVGIIGPLRPFAFTAADPSQDHYAVTSVLMPARI